jgi:hypothetical protein
MKNIKTVDKEAFIASEDKRMICGFGADITAVRAEDGDPHDSDNPPLVFTISTGDAVRGGSVINTNGWDLENYRKNPVILWSHNILEDHPPIGRSDNIWIEKNKLMARAQFMPRDMPHPLGVGFGHSVGRMYREGYMSGVSVGFGVKDYTINEDDSLYFSETELYEWSPTPIPKDPNALYEAERRGINTVPFYRWCERALDTGQTMIIPLTQVEQTHAVLKDMHGTTTRGKKIEIDSSRSSGPLDTLKRWVMPQAKPAVTQEDDTMDKAQFDELIEEVRNLSVSVKEVLLANKNQAIDAEAPSPEPKRGRSQEEEDAENLNHPDVQAAIREYALKEIETQKRMLRGELA